MLCLFLSFYKKNQKLFDLLLLFSCVVLFYLFCFMLFSASVFLVAISFLSVRLMFFFYFEIVLLHATRFAVLDFEIAQHK